jgi:hypothetical protein
MTFKTPLLLGAAMLMGLLTPAFSADADAPFVDSGHEWEGFYAGVGFGAGGAGVDFQGIGSKGKTDIDGKNANISGIVGYNYMAGDWLIGVESSLRTVGLDKKKAVAGLGDVTAQSDWVGTMQLRGGYAFDSVMFYGTAGFAVTDLELKSSLGYSFRDDAKLNGTKKKFDFGEGVVRVGFTRKF